MNEHYDEGAVIFQATCAVSKEDTPSDVATKVHALEYTHYPLIIEEVPSTFSPFKYNSKSSPNNGSLDRYTFTLL